MEELISETVLSINSGAIASWTEYTHYEKESLWYLNSVNVMSLRVAEDASEPNRPWDPPRLSLPRKHTERSWSFPEIPEIALKYPWKPLKSPGMQLKLIETLWNFHEILSNQLTSTGPASGSSHKTLQNPCNQYGTHPWKLFEASKTFRHAPETTCRELIWKVNLPQFLLIKLVGLASVQLKIHPDLQKLPWNPLRPSGMPLKSSATTWSATGDSMNIRKPPDKPLIPLEIIWNAPETL